MKLAKIKVSLFFLLIAFFAVPSMAKGDKWDPRLAEDVTRNVIEDSKQNLADSFIQMTHPTAKRPIMTNFSVEAHGKQIWVQMSIEFTGGFIGGTYTQVSEWKFSKNQNFGIRILSDDAAEIEDED